MKHEFKWEKDSIAEKFFRELDKLDEKEIVHQYVSFLRMLEEDIKKQVDRAA